MEDNSVDSATSPSGSIKGSHDDSGRPMKYQRQAIGKFREMNSLSSYDILQKLGQGTFGVVQKAQEKKTKRIVALKQLINHSAKEGFPITAMREITILKKLHHENVIEIIDMIYESPKVLNNQDMLHHRGCFYTVCLYMSSDLVGLLKNPRVTFTTPIIKGIMVQLLKGIQYVHEQKYLHRDIKAANILIDHHGVVKIADFGLARLYHGPVPAVGQGPGGGERNYTALVVTRWYRPPEILLGERKYTTAVDLWGVGCVFGELFTHNPILVGKTDAHQAQLIFQLVGPPDLKTWPEAGTLSNKSAVSIGLTCKRTLEQQFAPIINDQLGVQFLSGLLTLDPYKRMNALDALDHPYLNSEPLPLRAHEMPQFEECHEIDKESFINGNFRKPTQPPHTHAAFPRRPDNGPDFNPGTKRRYVSAPVPARRAVSSEERLQITKRHRSGTGSGTGNGTDSRSDQGPLLKDTDESSKSSAKTFSMMY